MEALGSWVEVARGLKKGVSRVQGWGPEGGIVDGGVKEAMQFEDFDCGGEVEVDSSGGGCI